ncbi:MAG: tRNA (cytidine/uridine-2'-O-)-methyltransferase TrmJ [Holosporales bacterium]
MKVVLVRPQLSENMGAIARAMGNFNLTDLSVVAPIGDVYNEKSVAVAAGNEGVLKNAKIYKTLEEAIVDCVHVYGTSAVVRQMVKPIIHSCEVKPTGQSTAIVFGPERTGLTNAEIALCTHMITIPVNPDFSSLNLGQAAVVIFYEWFKAQQNLQSYVHTGDSPLATQDEKLYFLAQFETILDQINFWRVESKKEIMRRNVHNTFTRHDFTKQEIKTLIGIMNDIKKQLR